MKRYIDADKFLKDETKRCGCIPTIGSCTTDNESLAYQLAKAPTADVVEVCRCSECKHLEIINEGRMYGRCEKIGVQFWLWQTDTRESYCSWGERRKDDDG